MTFSLTITAGREAFGDGSHPSTQGALAALESLSGLSGMRHALDIGCGCGILALKAAYQWHVPVLAADLKSDAVVATQDNARTNGLEALITAVRSDGFRHPDIAARAPYDLIMVNILADILVTIAHDLRAHLGEEGIVILSGLLVWQTEPVLDAYRTIGLTLVQRFTVSDWVTLVMQRQ